MTLQKPASVETLRLRQSMCLWPLRSPLPLLRIQFEAPCAYITCLCRGPLKPKLAAMPSAWSSRTPSKMSMTSCEIRRQGGEERREEIRASRQKKPTGPKKDGNYEGNHCSLEKSPNKVAGGQQKCIIRTGCQTGTMIRTKKHFFH